MKIQDASGKTVSQAGAIMAYFGKAEGQTLSGFMAEVKQLSDREKGELAMGAAKELGYTVTE